MIHTAELDLDSFGEDTPIELDVFNYLRTNGYPVDELTEAHAILNQKPDKDDTGHMVIQIQTLSKPLDLADAATDQYEMWCCDCRGFQFHEGVDLEEQRITEWGHCKHIESVDKSIKAQNDDHQHTL